MDRSGRGKPPAYREANREKLRAIRRRGLDMSPKSADRAKAWGKLTREGASGHLAGAA